MATALKRYAQGVPTAAWQAIPPRMRVLYISGRHRTGGWLAEAFAADSASEVVLDEAVGTAAGLAKLRDEPYDAVLVSHEPGELDALDLVEGYRGGGAEEPILVLGTQSEQELAALCYEVGADAYVCVNTTTTRNLIWGVARAVQRHRLIRENRRLKELERQRLQREHDEAERLLCQQRILIGDLESILQRGECAHSEVHSGPGAETNTRHDRPSRQPPGLPAELVQHYRELLRTYVIMGSGNLAGELSRLAEMFATAGLTARQTMQLHLHVLEELVSGLGTRSTRHVMTRADLLILEIMIHLAEGYRNRYQQHACPATQRMLPGFGESRAVAF